MQQQDGLSFARIAKEDSAILGWDELSLPVSGLSHAVVVVGVVGISGNSNMVEIQVSLFFAFVCLRAEPRCALEVSMSLT